MKPLLLLLGLSVAANAALFLTRPTPLATDPGAASAGRSASVATSTSVEAGAPTIPGFPASSDHGLYPALWEKLHAGDPAAIASLRAAGWPEEAIRAFIIAYAEDLYHPRARAIRATTVMNDYWRGTTYQTPRTAEQRKAFRELNREKTALIRSLLGPDYVPENKLTDPRYTGLAPTQIDAVDAIESDYDVLISEVRGDTSGGPTILLPEEREKLIYLEKEKAADLAKILTPAELLDYELRQSATANTLRNNLTAFAPTEQEFRELFALQKTIQERLGPSIGITPASLREATAQAQAEMNASVKKLLSPERYADYTRAQAYEYRSLYQVAARLNLPVETAIAAYDIRTDIDKRIRAIRPSGPNAQQEMQAARVALGQEAEKRLLETLGQRGLDAYKSKDAYWFSYLNP